MFEINYFILEKFPQDTIITFIQTLYKHTVNQCSDIFLRWTIIYIGGYIMNLENGKLLITNRELPTSYDLIIIGGGSAAFSAAITAENLGVSTLIVNDGLELGGTCVNIGCVPSKTLIRAAETAYRTAHSNFSGIKPRGADIDFKQIIKEKKQLVNSLRQKKYLNVVKDFNNLSILKGWAEFFDKNTIIVDSKYKFSASKFIIATGSRTYIPLIEGINEIGYLTNADLFDLEEKPLSITIVGAGYIGVEIAMAYSRLGIKVRIIETANRVLYTQTPDISKELKNCMENENIEILLDYKIIKFEKKNDSTIMYCETSDNTNIILTENGKVVITAGIKPNTERLGLQNLKITTDKNGNIMVNKKMETNIPGIYAAGDAANTPAYVYTAAYEGKIAVGNAFTGNDKSTDYSFLPWVIFTDPQVSGVGLDEAQAEKQNIPFEISKIYLNEIPHAITARDTRGFIKLIRNSETNKLIGARIIAPNSGEVIQQLSMALKYGISVNELAENFYPYLTLSEGIKLAAIAFEKDIGKLSCCAE